MCPQNARVNQHALTSAGNFVSGSKPRGSRWVWLRSLQFGVAFVGTTCIPFKENLARSPIGQAAIGFLLCGYYHCAQAKIFYEGEEILIREEQ